MEKISALMDGELEGHEAQEQLARLKQDQELVQSWHAFHVIGDALRGERALSQEFSHRLTSRLTSEPTVLAPRPARTKRFAAYALSAAASLSSVAERVTSSTFRRSRCWRSSFRRWSALSPKP